ncbi:MAG: chorismate synthase [Candidatus Aminicenantes bacterium]|nr:chorismate synthase [Candidatus Aminicenantes bacterium]
MLRFLTAGESHGPCLTGIIEGMPAGLRLDAGAINRKLELRKQSAGRGLRSSLEKDTVEILSGVIEGRTIGTPICLKIKNFEQKFENSSLPRPGHADFPGMLKYDFINLHYIAERASARETAMRVAVGTTAGIFLQTFGVQVLGFTRSIGKITAEGRFDGFSAATRRARDEDPFFCLDKEASKEMKKALSSSEKRCDSLGGVAEVLIQGLPPGLGSHVHWDRRLDGLLAKNMMSIPSVKAVEIGEGIASSYENGASAHDVLFWEKGKGVFRKTNRAGGIEGGMSNGETVVIRLYAKPVPTLRDPLPTVDIQKGGPSTGLYVRSDLCIVPSVAIIAEAAASWVLAEAFTEKFGGDTVGDMRAGLRAYRKRMKSLFFPVKKRQKNSSESMLKEKE